MYNLLVRQDPENLAWSTNNTFSLDRERLFEYCDSGDAVSVYMDNIERRKELPCLFIYEGHTTTANVGYIGDIKDRGSKVDFVYSFDNRFPQMSIHDDNTYKIFGVTAKWERGRTHWAVKNIDLYEKVAEVLASTINDVSSRTSDVEMDRIWGTHSRFKDRVFISHRASVRAYAEQVSRGLKDLGHRAFVAHDNIQPTREWRDETLLALSTMTHFVGLITEDFHKNSWTDQEIGFSFSREDVKKIFVKLSDADPEALASFKQAVTANWTNAVERISDNMAGSG